MEYGLFDEPLVGDAVEIGTSAPQYSDFLTEGEEVRMEFKGSRDALAFTDLRMIVMETQGFKGEKVAIVSIPWKSISAFSIENPGTLDLEVELRISGNGFGICELQFARGTDVRAVGTFLNHRILDVE